jgi:hypothetical protein
MNEILQKLMRVLWDDGVMFSGSVIEHLKCSESNGTATREKLYDIPNENLRALVTIKVELIGKG